MRGDSIDEVLPGGGRLQGQCAPEFGAVLDQFRTNYAERGEVGASVCITHHGTRVVDLWGGVADPAMRTAETIQAQSKEDSPWWPWLLAGLVLVAAAMAAKRRRPPS